MKNTISEDKQNYLVMEVFNNCPYENKGLSGADCRVIEFCSIFKKKGYKIHIYIHQAIKERYCNKGYKITVTSNINGRRWGAFIAYLWNGIRACFLQRKESISIIYSSHGLADVLPAFFRKLRNPSAQWMSGFHLIAPNPLKGYEGVFTGKYKVPTLAGIYQFFYQRLAIMIMKSLSSLVMVSNNTDKDFFLRKGFDPSKVKVVYGGINWEDVSHSYSESKKYDACFFGRIHPQKGISDLLEAWSLVCNKKNGVKLAMVGQLETLKGDIYKRGLEKNVEFLGFLYGVDKFRVLKSSKIFLFPSYYESFGIVVAEAMACGLPVVAYNLPIYEEIYPKGMVRVAIGDKKKFAEEITDLLSDEKRRRVISEEAKEVVKRFSWERMADQILNHLNVKI